MHRRIIRITAEDSPNVKLAQEEIQRGLKPSNRIVVPGILSYTRYRIRRKTWDPVKQCIGLDAKFWEGTDVLMFPEEWLKRAAEISEALRTGKRRSGIALGCDPGEGTANTSMVAVDYLGGLDIRSVLTGDTADVTDQVIDFGKLNGIDPSCWVFDAGGGGKQHKDRLLRMGYRGVSTVSFGSAPSTRPKHGSYTVAQRLNLYEERSAYVSLRSQMYYEARCLLDPGINPEGFGLPLGPAPEWRELHRQLSLIPLWYDANGKVYLPSKSRKQGQSSRAQGGPPTLTEIVGKSPDEADAFVVAIHRMLHGRMRTKAGVNTRDSMNSQGTHSRASTRGTGPLETSTGPARPCSSEGRERPTATATGPYNGTQGPSRPKRKGGALSHEEAAEVLARAKLEDEGLLPEGGV